MVILFFLFLTDVWKSQKRGYEWSVLCLAFQVFEIMNKAGIYDTSVSIMLWASPFRSSLVKTKRVNQRGCALQKSSIKKKI